MSEKATQASAVVDCAGFRIETNENELKVTRDGSPSNATPHILHGILLLAIFGKLIKSATFLYRYLNSLMTLPDILASRASLGSILVRVFNLLLPLLAIWAFYAWYLWELRKGYNDLHCTRENFELLNMFRGQVRSTTSYPRPSVKGIQFGTFGLNTTPALIFLVNGKRMRVLDGLKCVEAQKILNQLAHLGFDVVQDVGMPMMVEMEEERRKSWLGS